MEIADGQHGVGPGRETASTPVAVRRARLGRRRQLVAVARSGGGTALGRGACGSSSARRLGTVGAGEVVRPEPAGAWRGVGDNRGARAAVPWRTAPGGSSRQPRVRHGVGVGTGRYRRGGAGGAAARGGGEVLRRRPRRRRCRRRRAVPAEPLPARQAGGRRALGRAWRSSPQLQAVSTAGLVRTRANLLGR